MSRRKGHMRPKLSLMLGASIAAFAAGLSGQAAAQDAVEEEEIVVTGYRASLAAAIDIKREETAAVDAIVAEDIADFPDNNLSESIQRIPGVAITRSNGEGRQISVRGLGPQFTRVRLNGMEAMSSMGSTDAEGGTNRGRNFDFNIFASELFNSITVRKTAEAEVEEGSLGATVDLRTARPFDYDGFTLASSMQWGYNDLSETYDPRVAFLISDTFMDDRLGVLFSIAFGDRDSREEGASTVRWQNGGFGTVGGLTSGANYTAVSNAFHPRIPRYDVYEHSQERLGATFTAQFRPTENTDITLDVLYAEHDATRSESFLEAPVFSTAGASGIGDVDVLSYEIQGNSLVYGVFDDVDIRSEFRQDELATTLRQTSLTLEHEFSDNLEGHLFVGRSESDHSNPMQTTLLWDRNNVDGYVYDFRGDNRLPLITYGGVNVANPGVWTLSQIRLRPQYVDNLFETAYGDLEFEANDWLTLTGGLNFKSYEFVSREFRRSNGTTANLEGSLPGFTTATATSTYSQLVALSGRGLSLPAGLPTSWAAPDVNVATALWGLNNQSLFPMGIEPALGNNFTIQEEDRGGYVQADWNTEIAGMPFRGNIGVRYVETDQTSLGYSNSGVSAVQLRAERSYSDTLPSLNMVLEPMDNVLVRFAASDVMSRPNLSQLSPGAAVSVSGSNRTVVIGNPELDPFRARAYDLSLEWYFHDEALLSIAYFYKDVDSFIQTTRQDIAFTGNPYGLSDSVAVAACGAVVGCNAAALWQFSKPENTPGGPVEGFEISLQLPFYFLGDSWLSNFGVVANYTSVQSDIDYRNANGTIAVTAPLTGLSDESWNATLYYEDERLSARISGAYRSDYLTTIPGRNSNTSESTAGTLNVDFAGSYQISERLRFTLEGLNLTDEVNDQYLSPDDRLSYYHHYGRQVSMGIRFTY
ncbi:MAG: TonB-dependent receptor [Alphaproteobacteria bacterium]|nr:TonB-dependent receptor [Alphaproteobacteria bacterium]